MVYWVNVSESSGVGSAGLDGTKNLEVLSWLYTVSRKKVSPPK